MDTLRRHRDVLLRDIGALAPDALDWQARSRATSIGTMLLHIAAVEYLVITAVARTRDSTSAIDHDLWQQLLPGFARELGIAAMRERPLTHYLALLGQVREVTEAVLCVPWQRLDLTDGAQRALDALAVPSEWRVPLSAPLGLPFTLADGERVDSLRFALATHESYHRGQITLTAFLRRSVAPDASH
jgi:uncharacterized damage-inducible protein DinB